jgi:predicted nuclease of predicted toxin-antitoxin system
VRFFVDAQLPPALAHYLLTAGHQAHHVSDFGLEASSDQAIWERAAALSAVIMTKDEDFVTLRALQPEGPAIVWIRVGNTTRDALIKTISAALPAIIAALNRGESIVEVATS